MILCNFIGLELFDEQQRMLQEKEKTPEQKFKQEVGSDLYERLQASQNKYKIDVKEP